MTMAITKDSGRQYPVVARLVVGYADGKGVFDDGTQTEAIDVPAGAIVIGGYVRVNTVFNSTSSDALIVGDGVDPNRYIATCDLQSLGHYHFIMGDVLTANTTSATVGPGYKYPASDTIDITWTAGTANTATTGEFELVVSYLIDGKAHENQG